MDPLAVQQVKLKELIRALERQLESDQSTNRKASLELKAKLSRMRARISRSQAGFSREAAKKVLAVVIREAAELALKLVVEAFIRSYRPSSPWTQRILQQPSAAFERRAA